MQGSLVVAPRRLIVLIGPERCAEMTIHHGTDIIDPTDRRLDRRLDRWFDRRLRRSTGLQCCYPTIERFDGVGDLGAVFSQQSRPWSACRKIVGGPVISWCLRP